MESRREFVEAAKEPGINFAALCREHGISRKTGYKWLARAARGVFEDSSRKPKTSPLRVPAELVAEIVRIRSAHRHWGPKKIAAILQGQYRNAPTARTVCRILERCGLLQPLAKRRPRQSLERPVVVPKPKKPNDLWTVDFKGWWLAQNGERCEPLTVKDGFSHFVLATEVFNSTNGAPVRRVFERLFARYGLPKAIQTDNGTPFVGQNTWHGLSALSVWWTSLGIEHYRSRPATPSDNGSHERLHRDISLELEAFAALTRERQQEACDRWRHDHNHHRPHEANAMKTPASVYRRSAVEYLGREQEPAYPEEMHVRFADLYGCIKFKGKRLFLSSTLRRRGVGLEPTGSARVFYVWFAARRLGIADFTSERPKFRSCTTDSAKGGTRSQGRRRIAAHKPAESPRAEQRAPANSKQPRSRLRRNNPAKRSKIRRTG